MTDLIEIHIDHSGRTSLVGRLRYFAKARSQASIFEYADEWLAFDDAFAIDNDLSSRSSANHFMAEQEQLGCFT